MYGALNREDFSELINLCVFCIFNYFIYILLKVEKDEYIHTIRWVLGMMRSSVTMEAV